MTWWQSIIDYYKTIGEKFSVNPALFVGIHIVATPLFAAAVWWLVSNKKKNKSLVAPVIAATLIFNAANIYLVAAGNHIPCWVYVVLGGTTLTSAFFTVKKIRKKLKAGG